jgi:glutaconate CoA-transferase subunit B
MSKPAQDYTIDELMVITLARQFTDADIMLNGTVSYIPVSAFMLARETHAPKMTWVAGAVGVDAQPGFIIGNTLDPTMWKGCVMYLPQVGDMWSYVHSNMLEIFCIRGAQIDMYGNVNNSVIGKDFHKPKVRLPGSAGMGDMTTLHKRIYIWSTTHNPRTFVEKVDFLAAPGYLTGGDARAKLGLRNGPQLVVTDLCVMDFEPTSKRMRLKSVHRGVTPKQVQEETGFELLMPKDVQETPAPSEHELALLRNQIDPRNMRKIEFRGSKTKV